MKNIEKYPSTKGALDAYNSLASKTVSFDAWLVCEYKEPHAPTLVEAANAATKAWFLHFPGDALVLATEAIYDLFSTIEREKPEPCPFCGKEVVRRAQPRMPCGRGSEERRCEVSNAKNETIADICAKLKDVANGQNVRNDGLVIEISQEEIWVALDRIETAHQREVAELRECLEQAYGDKIGTYTMKGNEVERWRKALREEGGAK